MTARDRHRHTAIVTATKTIFQLLGISLPDGSERVIEGQANALLATLHAIDYVEYEPFRAVCEDLVAEFDEVAIRDTL